MIYANFFNRRKTPQSHPIPGHAMTLNAAGGYVFELDRWAVLDRFLILGSESGSYYATTQDLTKTNVDNLLSLVSEDGVRVVKRIVEISLEGRGPKNAPAIFALAVVASLGDEVAKKAAFEAMPTVCRTGTHLFEFTACMDGNRGWGRSLRRAVAHWYNSKEPEELEYQLLKYQSRNGWSNRDVLRLAHPKPTSERHAGLYKWACDGTVPEGEARLEAYQRLKTTTDANEAALIIAETRLPREAVPTELLNHREVWEALLVSMPFTAMLRNLATMTRVGLLTPGSDATRRVWNTLMDVERLKKARVHPVAILLAMRTYGAGKGYRGSGTWTPVPEILGALERAFYAAFKFVEPTGQRYLLGVDVSGSMSGAMLNGAPLSACEAATAMAMVTMETENDVTPMAFADNFRELPLKRGMRMEAALRQTSNQNFGATDCALPIIWAERHRKPVDVFVVYTDNETWYGAIHPVQALHKYRERMGIPAKLVVVGMTATNFTIADPKDRGMLDVVGFDSAAPEVIAQFARG